jgi:predicted AlkP superfamily pyrophosphatase or phosphodiesterase
MIAPEEAMEQTFTKRWVVSVLIVLLLVGGVADLAAQQSASGGTNKPEHRDKPYVVLVSLDGFKAEYLDRMPLPNLRRVMQRGTRAKGMVPVFPSLTFPNHYSLVTGLHPGRHGIVSNRFYDPARKASYAYTDPNLVSDGTWYGGEPIWVSAEKQGMVSACFFWPGSEASIQGTHATMWNRYDGKIANAERVKTVLGWLQLPAERRPHIITLYFSDVDSATHEGALEAPAVEAAAVSLDGSIGQLLEGLDALPIRDRVYLVITSDHGMVSTSGAQAIALDTLLDPTELADIVQSFGGPVANIHLREGTTRGRALVGKINSKLARGTAYLRGELPERFHYHADPRAGDIVVVMDESWTLSVPRPASRAAATPPTAQRPAEERRGQHGWDNSFPSMRAVFLIIGPGVRAGALVEEVNNVDVYPLLTELLQLSPAPDLDGRPGVIRALIQK